MQMQHAFIVFKQNRARSGKHNIVLFDIYIHTFYISIVEMPVKETYIMGVLNLPEEDK